MYFFEDFTVEAVFESRGRTITEADIVNFAGLSGDFVEIHINEEHARKSSYGRRIAHGALIFSISTGLMTQMNLLSETVIAFYGIDRLRFTRPVFIGDTVRVRKKVTEMGAIEQSAIKEAGNILGSAYMNALAEFMGMILMPSPPSLAIDLSDAVLSSMYVEVTQGESYVFCVESEFIMQEDNTKVRGLFLLLPDGPSLQAILRAIRVG